MVRMAGLVKRFGKVQALRGVDLTLHPGITALIGANGAGKTTLIKIACGVLLPDRGEVWYDGRTLSRHRRALTREIGVVFENAENVYGYLPVWANIRFFASLWDLPSESLDRARDLLQKMGLWDRRKDPVNDLSRGNKQKVAIILALMKQPRYLYLDEPTLGLDVIAAAQVEALVREWVHKTECVAVLTTHRMDLAWRLADRFVFLKDGRVLWQGSREDLQTLPHWESSYRVVFRQDRRVETREIPCDALPETLALLYRQGATVVEVQRKEPELDEVVRALLQEESR